ncbi:MFS general substrate transporter [Nemania sp. FL0031]|nr:MFS general substrate transporter [Nemania sp. FL0031]
MDQPQHNSAASAPATLTIDNTRQNSAETSLREKPTKESQWWHRIWHVSVEEDTEQLPPPPPPDGGIVAWTQVAMGHLVIFNTWGFVNSFGVFQSYYTGALHESRSTISWIGSVQIFLLFAIGAFSGRALDAGRFRPVTFIGYVTHILGIFLTSISTQYWHVLLTQGLLVGIGNGLLFCPTISLVGTYFSFWKSFAMGVAAAGSATGSLIYPVVVQKLLPVIGFGWTVRILGFITLFTSSLAFALLKPRLPPRPSGPMVDWAAFKEPAYVLYCLGTFLNFLGLYFAFYYIGAYARDIIGLTYTESINLILIINGVGYVGRILPAIIADKYIGALNAIIPCAFGSGILLFGWIGVRDEGGQIAFAVVYGLFASGVQSMFAVALSSLTKDLGKIGTRNGMCFTIVSLSTLIGPPIAGVLIGEDGGNYLHAQAYGGSTVVAGSLVLIVARLCVTGPHLLARA